MPTKAGLPSKSILIADVQSRRIQLGVYFDPRFVLLEKGRYEDALSYQMDSYEVKCPEATVELPATTNLM